MKAARMAEDRATTYSPARPRQLLPTVPINIAYLHHKGVNHEGILSYSSQTRNHNQFRDADRDRK